MMDGCIKSAHWIKNVHACGQWGCTLWGEVVKAYIRYPSGAMVGWCGEEGSAAGYNA